MLAPARANTDLPPLTGLRAVALAGVLACHFSASFVALLGLGAGAERFLVLGGYGVSLFFVLSGFILSHAYHATAWHWRVYLHFLIKRLARIYPLHLAVLLGTVALYEATRPWGHNQPTFDLVLFLRHLTLTQAWFDYTMGMWNQASWSISAEWFAYLCFPAVLPIAALARTPRQALVAAHAVLLLFAIWMQAVDVDIAFVHGSALPNVMANFFAGCFAYRAWHLMKGAPAPSRLVAYATFAMVPVLAATAVAMQGVGWWVTLPFPLAIICLVDARHNLVARALAHPFMVMVGKSSYAAYMVHGPLQLIAYKLVPFSQFVDDPLPLRIAIAFAYPLAMIMAGVVAHVLFEHPARAFIVRRLNGSIHGPDRSA